MEEVDEVDGGLVASGLAGRRVDGKGLVDEGQRWIEGGWMEGWMEGWWMEASRMVGGGLAGWRLEGGLDGGGVGWIES